MSIRQTHPKVILSLLLRAWAVFISKVANLPLFLRFGEMPTVTDNGRKPDSFSYNPTRRSQQWNDRIGRTCPQNQGSKAEWCEAGDESWEYPVTPCRSSFSRSSSEPVRKQRNNENLSLCHLNAQKQPITIRRSFAVSHNKVVQDAKKTNQRACLKRLDHYPLYMQPPVNAQPRDVDTFFSFFQRGEMRRPHRLSRWAAS